MTERLMRTECGDVLHDWSRGDREVVTVWRAEDINRFVNGKYYAPRATENTALVDTGRRVGKSFERRR